MNNLTTFGQIEEEILSHNLLTEWGKIEIGLICYQKALNTKADHFNLKSSDAIMAFVEECKKKKNIQLYVYSAKPDKRKQIVYGSSVMDNNDDIEESIPKKIRVYIFINMYYYNIIIYLYLIKKILILTRNQNLILLIHH